MNVTFCKKIGGVWCLMANANGKTIKSVNRDKTIAMSNLRQQFNKSIRDAKRPSPRFRKPTQVA